MAESFRDTVRKWRTRKVRKRVLSLIPFVFLLLGLFAAWLGGHGFLPLNPYLVVPVTLVFTVGLLCVTNLEMSTSRFTFSARKGFHVTGGLVTRVIVDRENKEERFCKGSPECTVCEALEIEWPFKERENTGSWNVFDEAGQDVTQVQLSQIEGILIIVFENA